MAIAFASAADLDEKKITFGQLTDHAYAYTAEGDPNTGVIVGTDGVMVIDAQATPVMAQGVIDAVRGVTDLPISHVLLTHYHAVRVLGASAYQAPTVITSAKTREMIVERGEQDYASEVGRFPRLFKSVETVPGLTWPTLTFADSATVWLGDVEVQISHAGEGHTRGDTIAFLPKSKTLFAGDLVEYGATPYCGDAQLARWPATLEKLSQLQPDHLVPGRGEALTTRADCEAAIRGTKGYVQMLLDETAICVAKGWDLKATFDHVYNAMLPHYGKWVIFEHCMPFNVTRAFDEASGITHPRIWTDQRDQEMWATLRG